MVDLLALSLSHALLAFAVWQLLRRGDLDVESARRSSRDEDASAIPAQVSGRPPVRRGVIWPGGDGSGGNGPGGNRAAETDA